MASCRSTEPRLGHRRAAWPRLPAALQAHGFDDRAPTFVSGAELDERYTRDRRDGLHAPAAARLGWAIT